MRPVKEGREALKEFARSARFVLKRRVANNPKEKKFLKGWLKRVDTYENPIY
jgi:hypothetical protein